MTDTCSKHADIERELGGINAKLDHVVEGQKTIIDGFKNYTPSDQCPVRQTQVSGAIPVPPVKNGSKPWYVHVLTAATPLIKSFANAIMLLVVGFFLVVLAVKQPVIADKAIDAIKDFAPQSQPKSQPPRPM